MRQKSLIKHPIRQILKRCLLKLLCAPFSWSHFKEPGLNRLQSHQPRDFLDFLSSWYAFKKKVWAEWCERVKWERPNGGPSQHLPLTPFPFRPQLCGALLCAHFRPWTMCIEYQHGWWTGVGVMQGLRSEAGLTFCTVHCAVV